MNKDKRKVRAKIKHQQKGSSLGSALMLIIFLCGVALLAYDPTITIDELSTIQTNAKADQVVEKELKAFLLRNPAPTAREIRQLKGAAFEANRIAENKEYLGGLQPDNLSLKSYLEEKERQEEMDTAINKPWSDISFAEIMTAFLGKNYWWYLLLMLILITLSWFVVPLAKDMRGGNRR